MCMYSNSIMITYTNRNLTMVGTDSTFKLLNKHKSKFIQFSLRCLE